MIAGELLENGIGLKKAVGFYIVPNKEDFPQVEGGGCGVVQIVYDVDRERIVYLTCNGEI